MVSKRVREIEQEIDASIHRLSVWKCGRQQLLEATMRCYRDLIELSALLFAHGTIFNKPEHEIQAARADEFHHRAGTLWTLKWAAAFATDKVVARRIRDEELVDVLTLGRTYEAFVNALKNAQKSRATIEVDELRKVLIVYEGPQRTEYDSAIVTHQRKHATGIPHKSLTHGSDRLTTRWTADDYRRTMATLADYAAEQQNMIRMDLTVIGGREGDLMTQPTIVWLERPSERPDCEVFGDLVMPLGEREVFWKLVSLLDTPIVQVGDRYCALSWDIIALTQTDDYMLRLAALKDSSAYSKATTLREDRMIELARPVFERQKAPWAFSSRVFVQNPRREVDILCSRGGEKLVVQLKSTLRPETPWESYKRNDEIVRGIAHTRDLLDRGVATYGFVITDGYRGDYECWEQALSKDVPIGTLDELAVIALNPEGAKSFLQTRVGINPAAPSGPLPVREAPLMQWTLRLVDGEARETP